MEAGIHIHEKKKYRTPLSIFDAIQIAKGKLAEKEEGNPDEEAGKPRDAAKEFYFPMEIF